MKIMERIALGRTIYLVLAGVGLLILGVLFAVFGTDATFEPGLETASPAEAQRPSESMPPIEEPSYSYEISTLTFGGSCTAGSMLGISAYGTFNGVLAENGAGYFFEDLRELFTADDFTLAGLNSTLTDRELDHTEKDTREWFTAPASAAEIFSESGVDALSVEFTRTRDYGSEGYGDTEAALDQAGVYWCDAGRAVYREFENGITAAVYCCKLREEDAEGVRSWIAGAREKADFVALYVSDTGEGHQPDEKKKALLRSYADAGADLIVGTNCKTLQPAEEYNGSYIVYSLGSLVDGASLYQEEETALLQVQLQSRDGELIGVEYRFVPCRIDGGEMPWKPVRIADSGELENILAFFGGQRSEP